MKAPSAMNRQPITFSYNPADDTAAAHIDQSAEDEHHAFNDMGIAKLHFQIGAGPRPVGLGRRWPVHP